VLYKHGGTYLDADTLFLRDMGVGREFCKRWSAEPYANSAVLRLEQGSETGFVLLARCAELASCHPGTC
jgi:hypothetical protein